MALRYLKVFFDWDKSTSELTREEKGSLIDALIAYAQGKPYELYGNERYVFPAFQLQIDRDISSYEDISEKRRIAGAKGGKQKQANVANASNCEQTPSKTSQDQDHDHDQDQDHDQDHDEYTTSGGIYTATAAADDARPDFNTVEIYAVNNLTAMTAGNMQEFADFKEHMPDDLLRYAIDEAAAQGKRTWAYVRSILLRYEQDGIKTVGDAKAAAKPSREKAQSVQLPPLKRAVNWG